MLCCCRRYAELASVNSTTVFSISNWFFSVPNVNRSLEETLYWQKMIYHFLFVSLQNYCCRRVFPFSWFCKVLVLKHFWKCLHRLVKWKKVFLKHMVIARDIAWCVLSLKPTFYKTPTLYFAALWHPLSLTALYKLCSVVSASAYNIGHWRKWPPSQLPFTYVLGAG